jgi:hypothetical protein
MSDMTGDLTKLLVRELEGFKRELALFPDDESVWRTVPGVTNSAANLALHVAGGLQYLVGAVLGGSGYVRDRDAEFNRRSGTRAEVSVELDRALAVVREVMPRLPARVIDGDYPEPVFGVTFRTGIFLLHLCAHAAFHLGQAGYLRRMATGDARSSGAVPLAALVSGSL